MAILGGNKALIFAVGGGGDITSAAYLRKVFEDYYEEVFLASIPWERSIYDPVPGPIRYEEIHNAEKRDGYAIVNGDSYAYRGGNKIVFQAAKVARTLDTEVFLISPIYGLDMMVRGIENIFRDYGLDVLISLDVGGDILSKGYEEGLWSPLADSFGLATTLKIYWMGYNAYVAVSSLGADGELDRRYLMKRINELAGRGGLIRTIGYGIGEKKVMETLLKTVNTEASMIAYEAMKGFEGELTIRGGLRRVYVDIISTLVFFLDPEALYQDSIPAGIVLEKKGFEEVNDEFISRGIPTEYELEKILKNLRKSGMKIDNLYEEARRMLMEKLKKFMS